MNRRGFMAALAGAMAWCGFGKAATQPSPLLDSRELYQWMAITRTMNVIERSEFYSDAINGGILTVRQCRQIERLA